MFQTFAAQLGVALMACVCGAALLFGRWPERAAGAVLGAAWVLSGCVQDLAPGQKVQPAIFAIDCLYAAFLLTLVVVTDRRWVIWAMAYQGLVVLTHIAAWLIPQVHRFDFFTAYYVWSVLTLAALAAGVLFERSTGVRRPAGAEP